MAFLQPIVDHRRPFLDAGARRVVQRDPPLADCMPAPPLPPRQRFFPQAVEQSVPDVVVQRLCAHHPLAAIFLGVLRVCRVRRILLQHNQLCDSLRVFVRIPDLQASSLVLCPFLVHPLADVRFVDLNILVFAGQLLHLAPLQLAFDRPPAAADDFCDFLCLFLCLYQRFDLIPPFFCQVFLFACLCAIILLAHPVPPGECCLVATILPGLTR